MSEDIGRAEVMTYDEEQPLEVVADPRRFYNKPGTRVAQRVVAMGDATPMFASQCEVVGWVYQFLAVRGQHFGGSVVVQKQVGMPLKHD